MAKAFRYEVHNPALKSRLKNVAETIKKVMPVGYGFALHIVKYGEDSEMFYASSLNRSQYINVLKEFIEHYEGGESNEGKKEIV